MPRFTILHASDPHLAVVPYQTSGQVLKQTLGTWRFLWGLLQGVYPPIRQLAPFDSYDPDPLAAFVDFAWNPDQDYDLLLLSGDLATTGQSADLKRAHQLLLAPATPTLATLDKLQQPLALMPGNHDRYGPNQAHLRIAPPGDRTFDGIFTSWTAKQGTRSDYPSTGVQSIYIPKDDHHLALVMADLTLAPRDMGDGPVLGWLGQGRAYRPRIAAMVRETRRLRDDLPQCTVLWVVHFDPTYRHHGLRLLQSRRLRDAAEDEKIPAILCGHSHHRSKEVPFGTSTVFVCGATCGLAPKVGNYLNLLHVDVDANGSTITMERYRYFRPNGFQPDP